MQIIRIFIFILAFIIPLIVVAQDKQTTSVQQVWLGYFNQTRFNNRWGMWVDMQLRTKEDFFTNFSQGIARLGLTYYLQDDLKATLGYAYINHFPADNHPAASQPEHRAWQQVQWHNRYKRVRLMQWLRLEERWRRKMENGEQADGYLFNYRVRYNFFSQFAFNKQPFKSRSLSFVLNDELHVNFGKEIVYNYFDQTRFFAGISYQVNTHDNLQFGYMNVFQQLAAGNRYKSIHAARVFFFHNLDLRKK